MLQSFSNVEEAKGGFEQLPEGAYVMRIVRADDHDREQYLNVRYEVAEGAYKDFFANSSDWAHETRIYYKGNAAGMFKRFYMNISRDNPNFQLAQFEANTNQVGLFDGMLFGAVVGTRKYLNDKGEPREAREICATCQIDDVRSGRHPKPKTRVTPEREAYDKMQNAPVTVIDPNDLDVNF